MESLVEMIPEGSLVYIMVGLAVTVAVGYWFFYLKPNAIVVDNGQFDTTEMRPVDEVSDEVSDMIQDVHADI